MNPNAARTELLIVEVELGKVEDKLATVKCERDAARVELDIVKNTLATVMRGRDLGRRELAAVKYERDTARFELNIVKNHLATVIDERDVGIRELATVKNYFLTINDFLVRIQQPSLFQFFCESVYLHNETNLVTKFRFDDFGK